MKPDDLEALNILAGKPIGRRLSLYVPSRDKTGRPVDHRHWMQRAMNLLTTLFGRCTAMPELKGTWSDPNSGKTIDETVHIIFSYVDEEEFNRHARQVRDFLLEMGRSTSQSEVAFDYDGVFYAIQLDGAKSGEQDTSTGKLTAK